MSLVRARWGTASAPVVNPFVDPPTARAAVEGLRIDLTDVDRVEECLTEIGAVVKRLSELQAGGYSCEIQQNPESHCSACPVSQAGTGEGLAPFCEAGAELETWQTRYAIEHIRSAAAG